MINLERARKLLKVKDGSEFIALNVKAAGDLETLIQAQTDMLLTHEECEQTVDEFRQMLIRLYPEAKRVMQHNVGINRAITATVEHIFLTGSGAPSDIARLRYQLASLNSTGKLSLKG